MIDDVSSSVALATICTLDEVCSEASATTPACRLVAVAVDDIERAVASIVADDDDRPLHQFADPRLERLGQVVEHVGAAHLGVVLGRLLGGQAIAP